MHKPVSNDKQRTDATWCWFDNGLVQQSPWFVVLTLSHLQENFSRGNFSRDSRCFAAVYAWLLKGMVDNVVPTLSQVLGDSVLCCTLCNK